MEDAYSKMSIEDLYSILITADGKGPAAKGEAMAELLCRADEAIWESVYDSAYEKGRQSVQFDRDIETLKQVLDAESGSAEGDVCGTEDGPVSGVREQEEVASERAGAGRARGAYRHKIAPRTA